LKYQGMLAVSMESRTRSLERPEMEWCLDFTDTVDWRTSDHSSETLGGYGDLIAWSLRKKVITKDQADYLVKLARERPSAADAAMKAAYELREATYRVFSAVAHGRTANQVDLDVMNSVLSKGFNQMKVAGTDEGFVWSWSESPPIDAMLYPLARSAAELLTSDDLARVKECANEEQGCGSLFLDCSKTQTRKWCSMTSCGNRAKLRTYYVKHKSQGGTKGAD
jgi:predicted RNA-binding Zn ribbon-like protein